MENKYKFWVARDKDGNLFAYNDKPTRCDNQKEWFAEKFLSSMENSFFPELKMGGRTFRGNVNSSNKIIKKIQHFR